MLGCGFMNPWSNDETVALIRPSQLEMRLERGQAAVGVRNQADPNAHRVQRPQRLWHVRIELEMAMFGPFQEDRPRHDVHRRAAAAHVLDDPAGVVLEHLMVVDVVARFEERRGRGDRGVEPRHVDRHAVLGATGLVAGRLEPRSGVDQREVDVEEDGGDAWQGP